MADDIRMSLAVALDVDDDIEALRIAREVQPYMGVAKVGLELFSASGPAVVGSLVDRGFDVFVDLKLHDIPTTVAKAARVIGSIGARYLTIHATGGTAMLSAGVEGFAEGAMGAGLPEPTALAVTVLSSDAEATPQVFEHRLMTALDAGCRGIVCSGPDVREAKRIAPRALAVVPGTRPEGSEAHDQARVATPHQALADGADILVIGRTVTHAADRARAAEELAASLSGALGKPLGAPR